MERDPQPGTIIAPKLTLENYREQSNLYQFVGNNPSASLTTRVRFASSSSAVG